MRKDYQDIKTKSSEDRIKAYVAGDLEKITAEEMAMLGRWLAADGLMQKGETLEAIINHLTTTFAISNFTAHQDVFKSMRIFGAARKIDKGYILYNQWQRAERTRRLIETEIEERGKYADPKMITALAKWEEICKDLIIAMPNIELSKITPPPTPMLSIPASDSPIELEDTSLFNLLKRADALIEDIPHEKVNNATDK